MYSHVSLSHISQPCKKSRKDGSSPVGKTITNYFSPVAKVVDKPFSPPRSNNIMDYFSRKGQSSKEKTSPPEQSKEKSPEAVMKQPSQKRGRKTSKAARKLVEAETVSSTEEVSCLIVEQPQESEDAAPKKTCAVLGRDTAALLAQFSADVCVAAGISETSSTVSVEQTEKDEYHEDDINCENGVKSKPELKSLPLSPVEPPSEKVKQTSSNHRKQQEQEAKQQEPEEKDAENSFGDVSMEVNVDETSQLNSSTITISFEDFVRSQSQGKTEEHTEDHLANEDQSEITTEAEKNHVDNLNIPKAEDNLDSGEPLLQVSPRTLTIQAEVHVVSPKQEELKAVGKVASIFNRRKGTNGPSETVSSPHAEAGPQLSCSSLSVKRKSNVVLQEEDLELAVLESESLPKCSEAERKQFMAAFKQPSLDGSKTKPVKSQGKQKQPEEKNLDTTIIEEDAVIPPSTEQAPPSSQVNNGTKKKIARKGRKKTKEEKEAVATPLASVEETVTTIDDNKEECPVTSTPSIPAVRRSKREAVIRHTPGTSPTTLNRKTRKLNESNNTAPAATALPDSPVKISTPKTRKSKHRVFVAEMVCPPDTKESPIRIHRDVSTSKTEGGSGLNSSLAIKTSNESKKRKQAKKLVEKAKVIQQSKKTCVDVKSNLRRSSRNEACIKKSYCEDEDSVICVEEDQTQTAPEKSKKALRSLNDVLGRATPPCKDGKSVPGSKGASLGQEKTARKVSIFDESSREGSENSQDDEQFRARREFLKSGLPESFRKQIAKTAATKEAYSLSCSFFQPVVHMKQPTGCTLWSLPWPESPFLRHLEELWNQTSITLPSVSSSFCLKTKPACRAPCEQGSGWRPEISESVRQLLMEEISTSNPLFPVQMFITRFLKRRTDHQQQHYTAELEPSRLKNTQLPAEPIGGKRKRIDDEGANAVKVAKKQRASSSQEDISTPELERTKRGGRTRRLQRSKPEVPSTDDSVIIVDELLGEDTGKKEDVLWTDKYQPQHSSDILDNSASVKRLHSWLKEWKLRADREERKKQKDKKQEEGSNDSDWDCGEEDSQDGEDTLCNTLLITGPTGVGKTAAVYACAQELGFKVFEVNASSQRSGRLILSQLKEATQSHQVDSQGVNAHKPTYFNSYGTSSSAGTARPGSSPRKVNSPRRVVSSPRKLPQSPRGARRGGLAPTSLANFFKPTSNKQLPNAAKTEPTASSKKAIKENEAAIKNKDLTVKSPSASTPNEEQSKKMATSLILFEEVDVIFDDDSGFLAAIKTFMTTTKRPVILTTSDPAFSTMFDGNFEEIHFKTPSVLNVGSYLQLLCLAEDMRTDLSDITSLLRLNGCDIRQSLLQLQFWTRSAGGRHIPRPLTHTGKNKAADTTLCAEAVPSTLPSCDTGCTETRLGLLNIEPQRDIWELLRHIIKLNSRRRGVDLLYSNMETLLPLPRTPLATSTHKLDQFASLSCLQPDMLPSHTRLLHTAESADYSDDGSPVKVSSRMKKNKRRHCLPDQNGLHSDSDSEDSFLSLCKPQGAPQAKEQVKESLVSETMKRKPLSPEERLKNLPVSQCLESVADFLDNMSYIDTSLFVHPEGSNIHRRTSPVCAVLKDGMTDESRVESERGSWVREERGLEIQAAVELLSFHRCQASVAEAWDKAQKLEGELRKEAAAALTLPVVSHCEGYSFTQDNPCQPQQVLERREVMESLMLRGLVGTFGNRAAAALDYLPTLRTICRSEQLKEQGKVKRRFLHYLDAIHLGLDKSTLQHLAKDFP
uniref:AAA+ ATPase domain-containing protein n=1 Tax=Anabas testudineus TaxID=64144 RepID=A0A7N6AYE4_ANATE